jgi:hypothetical protein
MVISPSSAHTLRVPVVWDDVVIIRELLVTDCAYSVLLYSLAIQQLPHFGWRPKFPESPWMVRIFDALNAEPQSSFLLSPLATTAE